jgi:hypothetical protein
MNTNSQTILHIVGVNRRMNFDPLPDLFLCCVKALLALLSLFFPLAVTDRVYHQDHQDLSLPHDRECDKRR